LLPVVLWKWFQEVLRSSHHTWKSLIGCDHYLPCGVAGGPWHFG
jgi:hypothetical protein